MIKLKSLSGSNINYMIIHRLLIESRLVNMLDKTNFDQEKVWKIVKNTRLSFLSKHPDLDCQEFKTLTLLSNGYIQDVINSLAAELKLKPTFIPDKNTSYEILKTAGEMFTYLNYCPPTIPKFLKFSAYLFQTETPKEIILGLKSLIDTLQDSAEKSRSIDILLKFLEILSLKQYEKVQIFTKGKCFNNAIFGNCTKKINVTTKDDVISG